MPITDDVEEKLRRNLMVFSITVMMAWWLGLKVPSIAALVDPKLLSVDAPSRIWGAAAALLIYCLLRYHFSEGRVKQSELMREAIAERRERPVKRYLQKLVAKKHNDSNRSTYEHSKALNPTAPTLESSPEIVHWRTFKIVRFNRLDTIFGTYRYKSDQDTPGDFEYRYPYEDYSTSYQLPKARAWASEGFALLTSTFASRGALEIYMPYLLAICALIVSLSMAWQ